MDSCFCRSDIGNNTSNKKYKETKGTRKFIFIFIFDFDGGRKKCNLQIMLYANLVTNSNATYFVLYYLYSSDLRFAFCPVVNY